MTTTRYNLVALAAMSIGAVACGAAEKAARAETTPAEPAPPAAQQSHDAGVAPSSDDTFVFDLSEPCFEEGCDIVDRTPAVAADGSHVVAAIDVVSCVMGSGCPDVTLRRLDVIRLEDGEVTQSVALIAPYDHAVYEYAWDFSCCDDIEEGESCDPHLCREEIDGMIPEIDAELEALDVERLEQIRPLLAGVRYRPMVAVGSRRDEHGGGGYFLEADTEYSDEHDKHVSRFALWDRTTARSIERAEIVHTCDRCEMRDTAAWIDDQLGLLLVAVTQGASIAGCRRGELDCGQFEIDYGLYWLHETQATSE